MIRADSDDKFGDQDVTKIKKKTKHWPTVE